MGLRLVREALADSPRMRPRRGHGGGPAAPSRAEAGGADRGCVTGSKRTRRARCCGTKAVLLGARDPSLWAHLASDPERVLERGRRLHGARPLGRRARAPRATLPVRPARPPSPGAVLPQDYPLVAYYRGYCARAPRPLRARRTSRSPRASPPATSFRTGPSRCSSCAARSRSNPSDATAHFLLGSLLLAGGQTEEALAEWEKARALDPRIPVLHRNVGLTLLYARRDGAKDALRAFEEGMSADPTNVELYQGADQALSLLGRGADERIAVLQRYPGTPLPSTLVYKLSLALAEAGSLRRGRGALPRPLLPARGVRDERAAGVPRGEAARGDGRRQGRAQGQGAGARGDARPARVGVRLHEGRDEAVRGRAALPVLPRRATGPDRRRRGGARALASARRPAATCGRRRSPIAPRSGSARRATREWRPRLEAALAEADTYLFRGGHYPALATLGRGLLLRALGRTAEGDEALRQVFTLPDKGMPHHMARLALEER